MKTKSIFAAIAVIAAVGATFSYHKHAEKPVKSNLAMANIEALTYDEWGYDNRCLPNGDGCMLRYNRWFPNDQGID